MGYFSCKEDTAVSVASSSSSSAGTGGREEKPIKIRQFHYSDLEAATNGFSDRKLLGRGSHGCVYKAVLRGGRRVAVKKPAKGMEIGDNEIEILSQIKSPRLVNLVGYAHSESKDRLLVVEFMSNGTLYDILHGGSKALPSWGRRVRLALQVAKAIETLHSQVPPVIHRDIKSANVLIDRSFNARLGDFGLALRCGGVDDFRLRSTPPAGTMGYLDPSYITPDNLSTKTDVFSFGILLLEIVSGRKAIDMVYSPPSIVDWAIPMIKRGKVNAVFDQRVPQLKDGAVKKQLMVIAAKCVRSCRERRPAMKEVAEWLREISKAVPVHSWSAFNNPCMVVETMAESGESRSGLKQKVKSMREDGVGRQFGNIARRVHSDLGFRSKVADLVGESEASSEVLLDSDF